MIPGKSLLWSAQVYFKGVNTSVYWKTPSIGGLWSLVFGRTPKSFCIYVPVHQQPLVVYSPWMMASYDFLFSKRWWILLYRQIITLWSSCLYIGWLEFALTNVKMLFFRSLMLSVLRENKEKEIKTVRKWVLSLWEIAEEQNLKRWLVAEKFMGKMREKECLSLSLHFFLPNSRDNEGKEVPGEPNSRS